MDDRRFGAQIDGSPRRGPRPAAAATSTAAPTRRWPDAYARGRGPRGRREVSLDFGRRRLHQQHGHRPRRPAARRRAARRPDRPGDRPDRALPGDLPDHPPVGLHGDRRRRRRMTATDHRAWTRTGPPSILRIEGDVTSGSEGDLMAAYGRAVDDGATAVVLDFSGLEYMNSGGIGLLVTLLVRAQRGGGRLRRDRPVRPLPPDPRR